MFWPQAYKWKPAANTGRECLCRGSLSLPEALESRRRASRLFTQRGPITLKTCRWRSAHLGLGLPSGYKAAWQVTEPQREQSQPWARTSLARCNKTWPSPTAWNLPTCLPTTSKFTCGSARRGSWWGKEAVVFLVVASEASTVASLTGGETGGPD